MTFSPCCKWVLIEFEGGDGVLEGGRWLGGGWRSVVALGGVGGR